MLRQLMKDSLVYGVAGVLSRGVSFLLLPLYTHYLTPADYGITDMVAVLGVISAVLFTLEQPQGFGRFYPEAKTDEERVAYASTTLFFNLIGYTLLMVVGFAFKGPLTSIFIGDPQREGLLLLSLPWIWTNGVVSFLQLYFRFSLSPGKYTAVSLSNVLSSIAMTVVFVVVMKMGVAGVLLGQISGRVLGSVVGFVLAGRVFVPRIDTVRLREMLAYSAPLVPSSLSVLVTLYIYRFFLKQDMSLADVGIYGIAQRFAAIAGLAMGAFQTALVPLIYNHYKEERTPFDLARLMRLFTAFGAVALAGLALFSREMLVVFTTPAYYSAAGLIVIVAAGVLMSNMYIFAPGLDIMKRTRVIAVISVIGALLSVLLNWLMIPWLGVYGAAFAGLISPFITFIIYTRYSQNLYPVPHKWLPIVAGAAMTVAVSVVACYIELPWYFGIPVKTAILGVFCMFVIAVGLVRRETLVTGYARVAGMIGPKENIPRGLE